jgi:hypothetical protein
VDIYVQTADFQVTIHQGIQVSHGIVAHLDNVEVLGTDAYYVTYKFTGWAIDYDADAPVLMNLCLKSPNKVICPFVDLADRPRPDVAVIYRFGPNHGFVTTVRFPVGTVSCLTLSDIDHSGRETYRRDRATELFCDQPGMFI